MSFLRLSATMGGLVVTLALAGCPGTGVGSVDGGDHDAGANDGGGPPLDAALDARTEAGAVVDTGVTVDAATTDDAGADAQAPTDGSTDVGVDALVPDDAFVSDDAFVPDAFMAPTLNGCTQATALDMTSMSSVTITQAGLSFTPPCIRVRTGTVVRFDVAFAFHPLRAGEVVGTMVSSDPSSPIRSTDTGNTASFTMSAAGAYGYYCAVHYVAGMYGAIFVEN